MFRFRRLFAGLAALCTFGTAIPSTAAPLSQIFDANSVKIQYLTEGTGEPVILIHGLYASAALHLPAPLYQRSRRLGKQK